MTPTMPAGDALTMSTAVATTLALAVCSAVPAATALSRTALRKRVSPTLRRLLEGAASLTAGLGTSVFNLLQNPLWSVSPGLSVIRFHRNASRVTATAMTSAVTAKFATPPRASARQIQLAIAAVETARTTCAGKSGTGVLLGRYRAGRLLADLTLPVGRSTTKTIRPRSSRYARKLPSLSL